MGISILLAQNIISMFLMGIIGYVVVRLGLLKSTDSKTLSVLTVYVLCPCVAVSSFQIDYTPSKMKGLILAVAASVVIHIIFIVSVKLLNGLFHFNAIEKASVIYSNAGNIIIPLVYAVLGKEWVFYSLAFIMVQTFLIWTHGKAVICGTGERNIRKIILNPNILAMILGFLFFVLQIKIPPVIGSSIDGLANMIGPASMLVIGMLLGSVNIKWVFTQKRIYLICFVRLILLPVIVVLLIFVSGAMGMHKDAFEILLVVLLATAAPVAAMVTQMAQVYEGDAQYAGVMNAMTVIFCIITMPAVVFLYEILLS